MVSEIMTEFVSGISKDVGAFLGAALGGLAVYFFHKGKEWWTTRKKKQRNSIPGLVSMDIAVYKHLTELNTTAGSDRAFVIQFHNGTYYINQANQMKMSCTHEIVKDGVSREQESFKDILLSKVPIAIHELLTKSSVVFNIDGTETAYFYQMLRDQGVTRFVGALMKEKDVVEGFVGISYLDTDATEFDEEYLKELVQSCANRIGFILRTHNE